VGNLPTGPPNFDSTEERVANEGQDNADAASRFPQIVMQLVDHD
jgi:hypothetical protein